MISIIICSRNKEISNELILNISTTIGCQFELITIDNSENKFSIFEAYNLGLQKSKSTIVCLMHDDVLLHTKDWGQIIISVFEKNTQIGLLGVAGSKIKSKMPSAWWECQEKHHVINIIQHTNNARVIKQVVGFKSNSIQEEVVVIDGVFMVMRKVDGILFNTNMKGYHNYDLNISLEYQLKGFTIVVTKEILIEHLSQGTIDLSWYPSTFKIHNLYKKKLPLSTNEICAVTNEKNNGIHFITGAISEGEKIMAIKVWIRLFLSFPLSRFHFHFFKILFKKC